MKFLSLTRLRLLLGAAAIATALFLCQLTWAQIAKPAGPEATAAKPAVPEDPLGRTTPRGTVLGFLSAARKGNFETAAEYLNTRHRGKAAAQLAEQLAFVLDRRLPARLNEVSDDPQGSQSKSLSSNQELVGVVQSLNGTVDVLLERVERGKSGQVWLFSNQTLVSVPDLYDEVNAIAVETVLPEFLMKRVWGFTVYGLLCFFVGLPVLYALLSLLNRLVGITVGSLLRRAKHRDTIPNPCLLHHPVRLLLLVGIINWSLSNVTLPLLSRQYWKSISIVITIFAFVWLFVMLSARCEAVIVKRLARRGSSGAATLVRPARAVINVIAVFVGLLFGLYAFGINPTAALAGLGVGGIAVALAAQKTLENVIGGASIIMDRAIRTGDYLKIGEIQGAVEEIGLRSTRVRTLDRTVVSVPNGQIASMVLENFSFRDWFWFRHVFSVSYETTSSELSSIIDDIRDLLIRDSRVIGRDWVRVRLLRFGQYGFELDVSAYLSVREANHFLEIQEELLFRIMDIVQAKGARIARPSQTIYLAQAADTSTEALRKAAPSSS